MRWPWVSRLAFEEVQYERDRLQARVDELVGHVVRMDRVALGRPEVATDRRAAPEPMPKKLREMIDDWSEPTRTQLLQEAVAAYNKRRSWEPVVKQFEDWAENRNGASDGA
jgi:hypothetical protein